MSKSDCKTNLTEKLEIYFPRHILPNFNNIYANIYIKHLEVIQLIKIVSENNFSSKLGYIAGKIGDQ